MRVAELPIPPALTAFYEKAGITELYPPQAECVSRGLFEGRNLLVSIPTASGKTMIAEMAMHHHIAGGGKCLYIVPLKALASEKFDDFSVKGVRVGISTGDFDRRDEYLGRNDIIIATSEKTDSLLRNNSGWLRDISLLVVDEVHLVDDPDRGPTLEMVITKMRRRNSCMQVIALSATVGNPGTLAGWLDAVPVTSSWRPVDLRQGVFYGGAIHFHDATRAVPAVSKFDDLNLMRDTIDEGGQCLVFVSSRRNAEAFAKRAAKALKLETPELQAYGKRLEKIAETENEKILAHCAGLGAAFHHAGLRREARSIVEEGFRKGSIRCIASTPTLAAGLNLPARRVIIRDYRRYESGEGYLPIPAREYHQMAGRAGRPRLDPYGEAVLIGSSAHEAGQLFSYYIDAAPEDVNSQCTTERALITHILSLIASGYVTSREALMSFMEATFYVYQKKTNRILSRIVDDAVGFLDGAEFIVADQGMLSPTEYGSLVSQLYIEPASAEIIVENLASAPYYADTGFLQTMCSTPDMFTLYAGNKDTQYLERFLLEHEDDLWLDLPLGEAEDYFRGLKTTMVLNDWSHEIAEAAICERYGIGPGDIYALIEKANWLLHASIRLAYMFRRDYARMIDELGICVRHGVKRELLPLIGIRNIGRVRARRLFNNGFSSPADILAAGEERISPILGHAITAQLFRDLHRQDDQDRSSPVRNEYQENLFRFGSHDD